MNLLFFFGHILSPSTAYAENRRCLQPEMDDSGYHNSTEVMKVGGEDCDHSPHSESPLSAGEFLQVRSEVYSCQQVPLWTNLIDSTGSYTQLAQATTFLAVEQYGSYLRELYKAG